MPSADRAPQCRHSTQLLHRNLATAVAIGGSVHVMCVAEPHVSQETKPLEAAASRSLWHLQQNTQLSHCQSARPAASYSMAPTFQPLRCTPA